MHVFCVQWAMNGAKIKNSPPGSPPRKEELIGVCGILPMFGRLYCTYLGWDRCSYIWVELGLWAPSFVAVFVGAVIILTLKDSPEAKGFEPVENINNDKEEKKSTSGTKN